MPTVTAQPQAGSQNLKGILALLTSSMLFMANDTLTKLNLAELPLGEILFVRNSVATLLCTVLVVRAGLLVNVLALATPPVVLRASGEALTTILFLTALASMPIANLSGIMQSGPLFLTAAGAFFLGERVGWPVWLATAFGLGGVLLIIKPGTSGYDATALYALGAVATVVLRDVATKRISARVPVLQLMLLSSVAIMFTGLALATFEVWSVPSLVVALRLLGSGLLLTGALYFSVTGLRLGDLSVVTPFRFSSVLWGLLAGYLVWAELPDFWSLLGMAIVTASGVFTFRNTRAAAFARIGRSV